ncbi:MAG: flagellar motor switch protein FliN [Planctomycetota bacterium]
MSDQSMIDELLAQSLAEAQGQVDGMQQDVASALGPTAGEQGGIDMLGDVDLDVTIELGRTEMLVEDVLRLASGSVVELDKLAGDPVDVYVNSRLVARGEVLVLNDNFCIRISEILADVQETDPAAHSDDAEMEVEPGATAT